MKNLRDFPKRALLSKGSGWNFTPRGPETGELCTILGMLTVCFKC